jgi:hypothetical protein
MKLNLSSKRHGSKKVIFFEQKGRLPLSDSREKSGTFMCL